jgi:hypothetical protein
MLHLINLIDNFDFFSYSAEESQMNLVLKLEKSGEQNFKKLKIIIKIYYQMDFSSKNHIF